MEIRELTIYNSSTKALIDPNRSGDSFEFCCYILNQMNLNLNDKSRFEWTLKVNSLLDFIELQTPLEIRRLAHKYIEAPDPWLLSLTMEKTNSVGHKMINLIEAIDGLCNIINRPSSEKIVFEKREMIRRYVFKNISSILRMPKEGVDSSILFRQVAIFSGSAYLFELPSLEKKIHARLLSSRYKQTSASRHDHAS